jgi:outer membrane protein OmpA-like peptidoglycan-associated protein
MQRLIYVVTIVMFLASAATGQDRGKLSTVNKKAEKLFYMAVDDYNAKNYDMALVALGKALEADPLFMEGYILKGDILAEKNLATEAAGVYEEAIRINPDYSPRLYSILGNLQLITGRYDEAKQNYIRYLTYPNQPEKSKDQVERSLRSAEFGIWYIKHPVPFNPVNLGDSINTQYSEYANTITADDSRLYFTRNIPCTVPTQIPGQEFQEEFFYSDRINDSLWRKALNLGPPINTSGNEGGLFISPDGRFLFFAACERDDGVGSCDIYWSKRLGKSWSVPENLGPSVNSTSWDSQPSFSSDGKTLYFASKRPGGKGSSDIWKAVLRDDMTWSRPVNLGDSINTPREEMAPFIHPDDQTLYFSSKGHTGMGGFDLYYSKRDVTGNWKSPKNMGYPINTFADEITLVVNASGDVAYISSGKSGGKGKQDIYAFKLYKEAQAERVTYFKGIVFNKDTKAKLLAAFELISLDSGKVIARSTSDPITGEFLLILPPNRDYALNVSKEGYLFYSDNFSLTSPGSGLEPFVKSIPLQPLKVGETVVLKNIFFDTDKFDLKPESRVELEKLVELLKKNPKIRIEISGHTDIMGTPQHNLELSDNRAKAVYDYLVAHGISKDRMTYAGYGITKPIDSNDTEQGRANNRRTEFRVTGDQ